MCLSRITRIQCQVVALLFVTAIALASSAQTSRFQHGNILAVVRHDFERLCCYDGTDAPLRNDVIEYDVSVQVGDMIYVGQYETWTSYLPICQENHEVEARTDKHFIYLKGVAGEEIRLPIVSRGRIN